MSEAVEIMTRSTPLRRALSINSTSNGNWDFIGISPDDPQASSGTVTDGNNGVWKAGVGGRVGPNRLFVQPYCLGGPGLQFSMRVYGWRHLNEDQNQNRNLWIWDFLAEIACVSCNQNGKQDCVLGATEYLCDTLTLTNGSLGKDGEIVSPGGDLLAKVLIDLRGCQKFQFSFLQTDPVPMNALWGFA